MGGLEDAVTRDVVDVGARRDADAAHLGSEGIGQIVAVEVHRRDDVELGGPGEHLLKGDVGDGVLHEDLVARIATTVVPADGHVGELLTNEVVAPLLEGALGELHDVALMHPVNPLAVAAHGVLEGSPLQTLRSGLGDGLDADAGVLADLPAVGVVEQLDHALGLGRARLDLHTGVDVFGVLPEDHHVDEVWFLHR